MLFLNYTYKLEVEPHDAVPVSIFNYHDLLCQYLNDLCLWWMTKLNIKCLEDTEDTDFEIRLPTLLLNSLNIKIYCLIYYQYLI